MNPASHWALRALQLFAAAAISLILAVQLGLQNPFWAAMPVWVVAQPHREDLLLRAVMRVAGTALGAAIGWLALTQLAGELAHGIVLVLAVGIATAATYWIGTAYSYGALLAGITVAVVLVPSMDHHVEATAFALDRIWCTLIGVIAVTAITFVFTPRRPEPMPRRVPPQMRHVLRHGMIAGGACLLGVVWLQTVGGPPGIAGAMSLSIFSLLIASSRTPAPMLQYMPPGSLIGVGAALAYRALDLSLVDPAGWALLLVMPFLAAGAALRSHPRSAPFGLDANMSFLLAAEAGTQGHSMPAHLAGGAALVASAFAFRAVFRRFGHQPG
ncbi:FUSC family protein [Paracoccus laeviglucosivorans]|uniref:Fusaric acid resistance protein family protein n=1 Tax=Paracoccus laeviglucosivorans TaxID=1197861 RepID=A0A521B0Y5_9RHOB|nr:FUSC family protein [Paracoccus laeviglucosivorans]SMO40763.1 Fusaric acid resistance protein family protein [Paracoccus laeviglucosivorans]